VKRLYTDKIIIAFTFLITVGIVGVIVYAALNPNQNIFNVPSVFTAPLTPTNTTTGRMMRLLLR